MNTDVKNNIIDTGKWFWSNDFISPTSNPLIKNLEDSYKIIIETLSNSSEENIVDELLILPVSRLCLLKHLMIILDTSAETLDRAAMYIYTNGITGLTVVDTIIPFKKLGPHFYKNLNNANIGTSDVDLASDIINLLCYASQSVEFGDFITFQKCNLISLVGSKEKLDSHLFLLPLNSNSQIKQLRAVDFGHQLEIYISKKLEPLMIRLNVKKALRNRYVVNDQQFDLVLEKDNRHAIIEIAFQETTNSTLERKGKQAKNGLFNLIDSNDDRLIYIVDGAGYFKRINALTDLVTNSHFSCNVSDSSLSELINYLEDYFK